MMNHRNMKKTGILVLFILALQFSGYTQQHHFVYLQTENRTPFYIQRDGKTISSTAAGYLILGKMQDGEYPLKLGVLGSNIIQEYLLKVEGVNAGYLVKELEGMGWALQNLTTGALQMSSITPAGVPEATSQTARPANSDTVVSTTMPQNIELIRPATSATETPPPVVREKPAEPAQLGNVENVVVRQSDDTRSLRDSLARIRRDLERRIRVADSLEQALNERQNAANTPNVPVEQNKKTDTTRGKEPRFLELQPVSPDTLAVETDTVVVVRKPMDSSDAPPATHIEHAKDTITTQVIASAKTDSIPGQTVEIFPVDTTITITADTAVAEQRLLQEESINRPAAIRKPCVDMLGRMETDELMARTNRVTDIDETLAIYKGAFERKCITTTNLQRIAERMASDVARFKLFEMAYLYTLDYYEYSRLESLIADKYYQARFREILKN